MPPGRASSQTSRRQPRLAFDALGELGVVSELDEFQRGVAQQLRRVLPCHHVGYTAIELGTGNVSVFADPPETVFDGGPELLARYGHQNPLLVRAGHGDERAMRISDFMTRRELHGTELYNHVYRWIPLEFQLAVALPRPGRRPRPPGRSRRAQPGARGA